MLANCIELSENKKTKILNPKKKRENIWKYCISLKGTKQRVCQGFLLILFQISIKRLRGVQHKVLHGISFEEKRGAHTNRPNKVTDDVVTLMGQHLASIAHDESHYCKEKKATCYILIALY